MLSKIINIFKIGQRVFFKNRLAKFTLLASLLVNVSAWILLYRKITPGLDSIALHSNIYFGIDLAGKWYMAYTVPLVGLFFILANFYLARVIYIKRKNSSYVLCLSTVLLQVIVLVGSFNIALINS